MSDTTNRPTKAIVLAAGLGKRMRPITDTLPKPLVPIAGKTMLDHALDRLADAGITTVVVNVHYHAEQIEKHLAARKKPNIIISDERACLLETGGGAKKALPHFANLPFLSMNSDCLWAEGNSRNLDAMLQAWDESAMDMLLLVVQQDSTVGYDGVGDFQMDKTGQLARRDGSYAPMVYAGVAIIKPELFHGTPDGPFSLNVLFDRAIARKRLFGHTLDGLWLHVGTPQAITPAEESYRQFNR
ncbi:MAG: nucleotidyltransferase family protein [Beijerinckiaceae bacterium]